MSCYFCVRSENVPMVNQRQASPMKKHRQSSTVTPDLVDTSERRQADEGDPAGKVIDCSGHSKRVVGDSERSSGDVDHVVLDAENVACREADESQPLPSDHGTYM